MASELSPVGILCNDILSSLSAIPGVTPETGTLIGSRVAGILSLFTESEERVTTSNRKISNLTGHLRRTKEQLEVLRQEHFGKSSEKDFTEDFDEDIAFPLDDLEVELEAKVKGRRPRKMPTDIPTEINHHYPIDRTCCTCGCEMASINKWTSRRLQVVPEHVICVQDVHHTCACNRELCKDNKPASVKANRFIMKRQSFEHGFMVEAAVQKFAEHIPPFRLERRLHNSNVNVSRQAISRGIARLSGFLMPIQYEIHAHVTAGHVAHMDETPMRIQAPGTGRCDKGYLWAICRDERRWNPDARPAAFYKYSPSRAGEVASDLLEGAAVRVLQVDGYGGYNALTKEDRIGGPIIKIGCWAHARRKFYEVHTTTKSQLAGRIVKLIQKMYLIEKAAAGLTAKERLVMRQERTRPILATILEDLLRNEAAAFGGLRKAINYVLKIRGELSFFVEDGRLEIDNNPVERCIRGIAITKKNSLFAGTHEMAEVWATYFTLIETCKLNRIDPRRYLNWATSEIERSRGELDYALLLPWHCPVGQIEV